MGLIDDFLEYLKVVKKHSSLTIDNYKIDLYNLFLISYLAPFYMQILYNNKFLRLQQKE